MKIMKILIPGQVRRGVSRSATMDFQMVDFSLFRSLVDKSPLESSPEGKGVQEG